MVKVARLVSLNPAHGGKAAGLVTSKDRQNINKHAFVKVWGDVMCCAVTV